MFQDRFGTTLFCRCVRTSCKVQAAVEHGVVEGRGVGVNNVIGPNCYCYCRRNGKVRSGAGLRIDLWIQLTVLGALTYLHC